MDWTRRLFGRGQSQTDPDHVAHAENHSDGANLVPRIGSDDNSGSVVVTLTPAQYTEGALHGFCSVLKAIESKKPNARRYIRPAMRWGICIEGFAAELAVACYTGQPWVRATKPNRPDVGEDIQVKWTSYASGTLLIPRRQLRQKWVYVLVTGWGGTYTIRGWIKGRYVKQSGRLHDYGRPSAEPAWRIEQKDLRPAADLLALYRP